MRIYFYQDSAFPYDMAAAKRRLCYIKGLKAAGDKVNVICCCKVFEKGEDDGISEKGFYDGTPYCYVSGKYKYPKWNKMMRGLDWTILDPIRTFFYSLRHVQKSDVVYVYLYPLFLQFVILLASKIKGAKVIKETCEHPSTLRPNNKTRRLSDWIDFRLIMPRYDGFIAISVDLEMFVNKYKKKSAKVIHIPILVDPKPYDLDYSQMQSPFETPYIIHTGTMKEQKDSITKILHAFARLKQEYSTPCKLVYEIIKLQHFAALAIIYKSDNLQTRNCFPTKLGEMLMSGVPVITTTVGDAKLYLESGVNAYLFEEDDEDQLVHYMIKILSAPMESSTIAKRGHDVALHSFHPISQGKRLSDFIHKLQITL